MQIIGNTYHNSANSFSVKVTTCNRTLATTKNISTGETLKFNRGKFEWMVKRGVFSLVEE